MLSIGELAGRAGVSRRMLRHWGEVGLVIPATVDEQTGYRRYTASQAGRVQAIAALRAVGFGLDQIADLLSSDLTEDRLMDVLRLREKELTEQVDEATTRLAEVRRRLKSLQEGRQTTMNTLELVPIAALRLAGLQLRVGDESELDSAVADLLGQLRRHLDGHGIVNADIVLTFFGPPGDAPIEVTVGIQTADDVPGLPRIDVPGAERGVRVGYDNGPGGVGDAWTTLDAALEKLNLRTTGVYRQHVPAEGPMRLEAPVEPTEGAR